MDSIHRNTIRHGGIGFYEYFENPYLLKIRISITTKHLSLFRISEEREQRLKDIHNLHLEGKSSKEITH